MAFLSLITGQPQRTELRGQDEEESRVLLIDVTTSRTPTFTNEVTTSPVEDGPDVNDHIRSKPVVVSIEGVISETPLTLASSLQGLATAAGGFASQLGGFGSTIGSLAGGFIGARLLQSDDNPAAVAQKYLEDLALDGTRFTITGKTRKFENMVVLSLSTTEDPSTAGHLKFSMTCQQVNVVKTETVVLKKLNKAVAHKAASPTKMGKQTPTASAEKTKKSSVAYKILRSITGGG